MPDDVNKTGETNTDVLHQQEPAFQPAHFSWYLWFPALYFYIKKGLIYRPLPSVLSMPVWYGLEKVSLPLWATTSFMVSGLKGRISLHQRV